MLSPVTHPPHLTVQQSRVAHQSWQVARHSLDMTRHSLDVACHSRRVTPPLAATHVEWLGKVW